MSFKETDSQYAERLCEDSMIVDRDQRKYPRTSIVWKVIVDENSDIKAYIRDFSKQGIRLWVNNNSSLNGERIVVQIPYPDRPELEPLQIEVAPVWKKRFSSLRFSELGCKYNNLSAIQELELFELMNFFTITEHLVAV